MGKSQFRSNSGIVSKKGDKKTPMRFFTVASMPVESFVSKELESSKSELFDDLIKLKSILAKNRDSLFYI